MVANGVGGRPSLENRGDVAPGNVPLQKNFKAIIFFISTHRRPEFKIIQNPERGGGLNFFSVLRDPLSENPHWEFSQATTENKQIWSEK